jgi:putative sterol carrier protein
VNLKSGKGSVAKGEGAADLTVTVSDDTFFDISQGKMNAQQVRSARPLNQLVHCV